MARALAWLVGLLLPLAVTGCCCRARQCDFGGYASPRPAAVRPATCADMWPDWAPPSIPEEPAPSARALLNEIINHTWQDEAHTVPRRGWGDVREAALDCLNKNDVAHMHQSATCDRAYGHVHAARDAAMDNNHRVCISELEHPDHTLD